jgi:Fe-S cluster assembly protein SufD
LAQESLVLFNQATVQEGLYIRIGGENNRVTIRYTNHAGGDQLMSFRVLVDVSGSGQIVEIIESETGVGLTNLRSQILVNPQGYLTHLRQQALGADGTHFSNVEARVARDGTYRGFTATVSGRIVRNDCTILLQETNATGHFDGIFMAREGQHVDNCFLVDHQASETHSSQNFRGILGAGGRGVFAGKIWLREAATRSDAKQLNQNLMLADDCEMDTKPQLKIDTDEVKCSHGASVGRPSEQELFYLASRGISRGDALAMISRGFLRAALWDNTPTVLQQQISQASAGFFQMLQEQQ